MKVAFTEMEVPQKRVFRRLGQGLVVGTSA